MLPLKVRHRLELGRVVSAEVKAYDKGNRAWVYIIPLIDPMNLQSTPHSEPILIEYNNPLLISGYKIWYREIDKRFIEYPDDWDMIGLSVDSYTIVRSLDDVLNYLVKEDIDPALLGLPYNDGSPF